MDPLPAAGAASLLALMVYSFILGLSGAIMPGTVMTVTIAHAARRGANAGILVSAGHAFVELALVVLLVAGATTFFKQSLVQGIVAIAGALTLGWMAWSMLKEARTTTGLPTADPQKGFHLGPLLDGALASIINPYWYVWWVTVGTGYLVHSLQINGSTGLAAFYLGHIGADVAVFSTIAVCVARGRRFLTPLFYKWLLAILACFLIILAHFFVSYGVTLVL